MKFSALVTIVSNDLEEEVRDVAQKAGAGGVTIIAGRGSGIEGKKSFLGLSIEGQQTLLLYVLEKHLAVRVLKDVVKCLELSKEGRGLAFTVPIEHIGGINLKEVAKFEEQIKDVL